MRMLTTMRVQMSSGQVYPSTGYGLAVPLHAEAKPGSLGKLNEAVPTQLATLKLNILLFHWDTSFNPGSH